MGFKTGIKIFQGRLPTQLGHSVPEALIARCPNGIWSLRKGHHRVCYQEGPYGPGREDGGEIYFEARNQSKDTVCFFCFKRWWSWDRAWEQHIISMSFFLNLDLVFNNYPWVGEFFVHKSCHRKCQSFDSRRPRSPTRRLTKPSWRRPITIGSPGVVRWNDIYTFPMKVGYVVWKFAFWLFFLVFEPREYHKSQVRQVGWMRRVDTRSDVSEDVLGLAFFRTEVEGPCSICVFFKSHVNKRWWILS